MINKKRRSLLGNSIRLAFGYGLYGYAASPAIANIRNSTASTESIFLSALDSLPDGINLRNTEDVLRVYRRRSFSPLWHKQNRLTYTGQSVIKKLTDSYTLGLDPSKYYSKLLDGWASNISSSATNPYHLELVLTDALYSYFNDLAHGNLSAPARGNGWYLETETIDVRSVTDRFFSGEQSFRHAIAELQPNHRRYQQLLVALQEHHSAAERGGWTRVPTGPTLRSGERHPRVSMLRRRLGESGDLPLASSATNGIPTGFTDDLFDSAVSEGLKAYQLRHGLKPDSLLGKRTVAELNVPVQQRIAQIEVNLDRWRWLPRDPGSSHIMVNTAGYDLEVALWGEVAMQMNVVVGKPKHRTPLFSDTMEYLVVNPSWYVPKSIAREIMPKEIAKPGYLKSNNFEVISRSDNRPVEHWRLTSEDMQPNTFVQRYRLRQLPGKSNALGDLKFMMPNDFSIYLHDTNAKSLFAKNRRAYSHGCIRVEHPQDLARLILSADGWSEPDLAALFNRKDTQTVRLKSTLPVHLTYQSSWVDNEGRTHFREDIYKHDALALQQQQDYKLAYESAQTLALASAGDTVASNTY